MRRALVSSLATLGLTLGLSACGDDGPLARSPEDGDSPQLSTDRGAGPDGPLERVVFIHWQRGFERPDEVAGVQAPGSCFALIANGARWKQVEPWEVLSGTSDGGVGANAVKSKANASINEWESHLAPSGDILGSGSLGTTPVEPSAPDGHNVVQFGNDPRAGVIAVTTAWGFFTGPVANRRIVEWDMILDTDFTWSTSGEPGKMDLRNILTHELGHAMGLAHPVDSCTLETMYRFASNGETKKRTLHGGDIAGINTLY